MLWLMLGFALAYEPRDTCVRDLVWQDMAEGWSIRNMGVFQASELADGVQLTLFRDTKYHIIGCSSEARRVQLGLYDMDGFRVASDEGPMAELRLDSEASATHVLRASGDAPVTVAVLFR